MNNEKRVGRPKKGHIGVLIGFTHQNKRRMDMLLEKLNKDRKKLRFSRTDIVNDSVSSFCDEHGIPYLDRQGVEL
jgi:hypothetical protein